jgi:hypothetical protein
VLQAWYGVAIQQVSRPSRLLANKVRTIKVRCLNALDPEGRTKCPCNTKLSKCATKTLPWIATY